MTTPNVPASRVPPEAGAPAVWQDPIPLPERGPLPPFPVDALPLAIAHMVAATAKQTQTDPGMAGTAALAALAACTAGHVDLLPKPGWIESCTLYTVTVADPAERKSAVLTAMAAPLYAAETTIRNQTAGARSETATRRRIADKAADKAEQGASGSPRDDAMMSAAVAARLYAEGIVVPPLPRLIADDVTPEALTSLMAEQGDRWLSSPPRAACSKSWPAATATPRTSSSS